MVYSAKSDDTDTISQFTRRKAIKITTGGTSTPANYQVKVTISYEPGMQSLFQDIRFNTKSGVYIDYWIESYVASTSAVVWIELPDAITDPGSDTIWMYYGNDGLSDGSNIDNTFLFGDDFTGDLSKWNTVGTPTISSGTLLLNDDDDVTSITTFDFGVIVTSKVKADEQDISFVGFYKDAGDRTQLQNSDSLAPNDFDRISLVSFENDVWEDFQNNEWDTWQNIYHQYTIKRISSSLLEYSQDSNSTTYTNSSYISTQSMVVNMYVWDSSQESTLIADWIFVRKYIADEPTASYGTSQHQRRTPQFM